MSDPTTGTNKRSMIAAIIAATGASLCCIGPLVLLAFPYYGVAFFE